MAAILIIDDEASIGNLLSRFIKKEGHDVVYAATLAQGLDHVETGVFDVVFLDVHLPDGNGLESLPLITAAPSSPEVIIITGEGDPDGAELAIKSGAWTYILKPPSLNNILLQLNRALQYRKEKANSKPPVALKRERIIGRSPQLAACLDMVAQVASVDVPVMITGETGTGKDLFARAIHDNSARAGKQFVVVDCASIPETLVGSMLFGHEKGAFTGAQKERAGLILEAHGGTLFLDEIGELPATLQKDFLRVLQEFRFRPLGSNREIKSNFRLIAATNRDLKKMADAGQFRTDLLFRIRTFCIDLPPLRDRSLDIRDLVVHCMNLFCEREGIETKGFSPDFFEMLAAYDWPGNVRELYHTLEQVLTIARFEPTLYPRHLPNDIRTRHARAAVGEKMAIDRKNPKTGDDDTLTFPTIQQVRDQALAKTETQYLHDLMTHTGGDVQKAVRISGLSQSRLYYLMKKYRIARP
ncbi:MAG: sigma-54-dependent Fis family transcriptional regulator [Desulfobacteraceae bacterium]|jgi:two-component system NtrC family response regulator|nr:MAG: sigma-54-dependent Fis family transcriptional regulator [Desulfobacteraceae bacterium]